jgi:GNAT superfamily N-acetyltransferase
MIFAGWYHLVRKDVSPMMLANAYYPLPPGKLANVVTRLEMTERPAARGHPVKPGVVLQPADRQDLAAHRALFAAVGRNLLWFSRLIMPDEKLTAILSDPDYDPYVLMQEGQPIGMLDLDFREQGQCELAFFGLTPDAIGGGHGAALMDAAIDRAWSRPITRLWLHTCTNDHPAALGFYRRSGFTPYQFMVEIHDDPRLLGHLPRDACPHVPLIEAREPGPGIGSGT